MTQINTIDFVAKRLHLHEDTVTAGFNVIDAYNEIRQTVAANVNAQSYLMPLSAEGNIQKNPGAYTARYGLLAASWRLVPYYAGGVSYNLDLLVEILSKDNLSDRSVFDRSGIPEGMSVNIDAVYDAVEVRLIETRGALLPDERAWLQTIHNLNANDRVWDRVNNSIIVYTDASRATVAHSFTVNSDLTDWVNDYV